MLVKCFNFDRSEQAEKEREYEEFRRRKYGDSRDWGKVSAGNGSFSVEVKSLARDEAITLRFTSIS